MEHEVKVEVPPEVVELETESFEDLGPSVSLQQQHPEHQDQVVLVPPEEEEEEPHQPAETNITAIDVANPYLTSTTGEMVQRKKREDESSVTKFMSNLDANVASELWITGKDKAAKWAKLYGDIDTLRPFFDVEPRTIANRVFQSFIPITDLATPEKVPSELYGPLMTTLTLVAVLQMNMKTSKTSIEEATLIETALTACFGYWAFLSCFIYCAVYVCSSYINTIQIISLAGYGICSHVLVSFLSEFFHYGRGPFMLFWFTFCGASALRMGSVLASRTVGNSQRILLVTLTCLVHMSFLLYLHFSYHHIVTEIEHFVENIEKKLDLE